MSTSAIKFMVFPPVFLFLYANAIVSDLAPRWISEKSYSVVTFSMAHRWKGLPASASLRTFDLFLNSVAHAVENPTYQYRFRRHARLARQRSRLRSRVHGADSGIALRWRPLGYRQRPFRCPARGRDGRFRFPASAGFYPNERARCFSPGC